MYQNKSAFGGAWVLLVTGTNCCSDSSTLPSACTRRRIRINSLGRHSSEFRPSRVSGGSYRGQTPVSISSIVQRPTRTPTIGTGQFTSRRARATCTLTSAVVVSVVALDRSVGVGRSYAKTDPVQMNSCPHATERIAPK